MIALVLGGSARVWEDAEAARALAPDAPVVAVNDAIPRWEGDLAAAVTLHAEKLADWIAARRAAGLPEPVRFITMDDKRRPAWAEVVPHHFEGQASLGSSGLFAVKVALHELGADGVILCGIGMDPTPHFVRGGEWRSAPRFRRGWVEVMPALRDRVRSMSGWTRERLGAPSPEWVARHR